MDTDTDTEIPTDLPGYVRYGHALGWSFTPLSGKAPILKGWQKRPREDLDQALQWTGRGNVGLRTGAASGVVVIDVDPGADVSGLDLPETVQVRTGREGGRHYYFRCSEAVGNSNGRKLGENIDFKGDGGQVVFVGCFHPETGRQYQWAEGRAPWQIDLAILPEAILRRLQAPLVPTRPPTPPRAAQSPSKATPYATTALKLELGAVCRAVEGHRNAALNKAAFSLGTLIGAGALDRGEVEAALLGAAESTGLGRGEALKTIRSALDSGIAQPRDIDAAAAPQPSKRYILTPGAHKDDEDRYYERSCADFADEVLASLPAGAVYRKDFIVGEILGPQGKRGWVEFNPDRMRIVADSHVKQGKWVTSRKTGRQVHIYQSCSKDGAGVIIAHARQSNRVRELELMVSYPVYGPGFSRILPGYKMKGKSIHLQC